MRELTFSTLLNAEFRLYEGNPIIRRHGFSTVVADPFVLTPDLTHDGRWKLFAHTLEGVFIYDSADGLSFGKGRKILSRAMRPSVVKTEDGFILYYEPSRSHHAGRGLEVRDMGGEEPRSRHFFRAVPRPFL